MSTAQKRTAPGVSAPKAAEQDLAEANEQQYSSTEAAGKASGAGLTVYQKDILCDMDLSAQAVTSMAAAFSAAMEYGRTSCKEYAAAVWQLHQLLIAHTEKLLRLRKAVGA